ncbi:MAG: ABC transporter permease, partial [Bacteroides sp.]|nr:ABC transporter permease [Bacteroides sp.]
MIEHNLTLAWRQLMKYRLQSAVSVASLAIGFACFALASMWIKYETTYDAFHKDADRTYYLQNKSTGFQYLTDKIEQFPEVEEATHLGNAYHIKLNGQKVNVFEYQCDSNFLSFFGTEILEGDDSFLHTPSKVAITDKLARRLWGDESPIGQELRNEDAHSDPYQKSRTVAAVIKGWGEHSNFDFEVLGMAPAEYRNNVHHFFRFSPKANADSINARLDRTPIPFLNVQGGILEQLEWQELDLVRLDKVRQADERYEANAPVKLNHIYLFAIAGGVLILCGLLNYLTMFINRLFIRQREIALRTVFGATGSQLMVQFLTEYGLLLLIAIFFGNYLLKVSLGWFRTLATLPEDLGYIQRESLFYMTMVVAASLLLSLPFIWYFRRQSLQNAVTGVGALSRYNLFRRISTGVQLGIAMCCIFCVVVLMKQLHTLRQGDLGFTRENIGFVRMDANTDDVKTAVFEFLKQQPEVDTIFFTRSCIYPHSGGRGRLTPEVCSQLTEPVDYYRYWVDEGYCRFYGLQLLAGRWPNEESDKNAIVVNETFARLMGWENPVEESYHIHSVIGVVKDFKNFSPTTPVSPCIFQHNIYYDQWYKPFREGHRLPNALVFRFHPGTWPALKEKLEKYRTDGHLPYAFFDSCMERYSGTLKSEDNLQTLLTITTSVCILIALFGVWSMIMLTCEQRRKEIAIRKVFGATVKDILDMFFGEYMLLQTAAALVAFPIGYACMKPWLEQYVVQTEISWWIYVGIFLLVALLVALCI